MTLSTIIICKNEQDMIEDCLKSVSFADEIIVLDSGSTDKTLEIVRRYTPHVFETDWPGFGPQKNRALEKASGDWVLSIDADERVTPELQAEIEFLISKKSEHFDKLSDPTSKQSSNPIKPEHFDKLSDPTSKQSSNPIKPEHFDKLSDPTSKQPSNPIKPEHFDKLSDPTSHSELPDAFDIRRISYFLGQKIRFGDWKDKQHICLFRRGTAKFSDDIVHERVIASGNLQRLTSTMDHYPYRDLADIQRKTEHYAQLGREKRIQKGKKGGFLIATSKAGFAFIRSYCLKLGFLDGKAGFLIAKMAAKYTFCRYV